MKIEIRHKTSGEVMFACDALSVKAAVELAVKASADLKYADLKYADLKGANLKYADLKYADLKGAYLKGAYLEGAYLEGADLKGAYLKGAYLEGAHLDYSCWPLWCGSNHVKVDAKIAAQLAAHFCALDCKDKEYLKAKKAILKFAMTSHRSRDLGLKEEI